MEKETLLVLVRSLASKYRPDISLDYESNLMDKECGIDSLDFLAIVVRLEKEFNISISGDDIEENKLAKVGNLIDFIIKLKS